MWNTILGIFFVLHGLVHLLYFALSRKYFELEPPLVGWPERSWLFSSILADASTRLVASVLYGLATLFFVVGGVSLLARTTWANTPAAERRDLLVSGDLLLLGWTVAAAAGQRFCWHCHQSGGSGAGRLAAKVGHHGLGVRLDRTKDVFIRA